MTDLALPLPDAPALRPLARASSLVVILGLEGALRPLGGPAERPALDGACVRMLDALAESGVRVVIASALDREALEPWRAGVARARFATEPDLPCLIAAIRTEDPDARVIAIGDFASELFAVLDQVDAALAVAPADGTPGTRVLVGPFAVRELLWWLVRERRAV
jgi:hypothetical protein